MNISQEQFEVPGTKGHPDLTSFVGNLCTMSLGWTGPPHSGFENYTTTPCPAMFWLNAWPYFTRISIILVIIHFNVWAIAHNIYIWSKNRGAWWKVGYWWGTMLLGSLNSWWNHVFHCLARIMAKHIHIQEAIVTHGFRQGHMEVYWFLPWKKTTLGKKTGLHFSLGVWSRLGMSSFRHGKIWEVTAFRMGTLPKDEDDRLQI